MLPHLHRNLHSQNAVPVPELKWVPVALYTVEWWCFDRQCDPHLCSTVLLSKVSSKWALMVWPVDASTASEIAVYKSFSLIKVWKHIILNAGFIFRVYDRQHKTDIILSIYVHASCQIRLKSRFALRLWPVRACTVLLSLSWVSTETLARVGSYLMLPWPLRSIFLGVYDRQCDSLLWSCILTLTVLKF